MLHVCKGAAPPPNVNIIIIRVAMEYFETTVELQNLRTFALFKAFYLLVFTVFTCASTWVMMMMNLCSNTL